MHDEQILDGSDDTIRGSTQIQRRTALKETMKAALLILDGLDRSSIIDLAKDREYRDLVHHFIAPLTSRPLHDAVDQANRVLKNGLDDISRGMAGIFPLDKIPMIVNPSRNAPSRTPTAPSELLPFRSQPTATTTFPEPSFSSWISFALMREPPNPLPMTPLEQIRNDKRKMVTIHFLVGTKKRGTTLKDVVDAVNEAIRNKVDTREQRALEAWMTKRKDIILAFQSPLDANDLWTEYLYLSHLWDKGTVLHVRRGTMPAYVARVSDISLGNHTVEIARVEWLLGNEFVEQLKTYFECNWGAVDSVSKLGPGTYLCSGSDDIMNDFACAFPGDISFLGPPLVGSSRQVYHTKIIGQRLSNDLGSIDYSST